MSAPSFRLSTAQIYLNKATLDEHRLASEKNKNSKIYVTGWGHTFECMNTNKIVYRILYKVFAALGLIRTEDSDYFKRLEDFTNKKFTDLTRVPLTNAITKLNRRISDLEQTIALRNEEFSRLQAENPALQNRNRELSHKIEHQQSGFEAEFNKLNVQLKTSVDQLDSKTKLISSLESNLIKFTDETNFLVAKKDEEIRKLTTDLSSLKNDYKAATDKSAKDHASELARLQNDLENQIKILKKEKGDLEKNSASQIKSLTDQLGVAIGEKYETAKQFKEAQESLKKLQTEHTKALQTIDQLVPAVNAKDNQIKQLEKLIGENERVTASLKLEKTSLEKQKQEISSASEKLTSDKNAEIAQQQQRILVLTKQIEAQLKEKESLTLAHKKASDEYTIAHAQLNAKTGELQEAQEKQNRLENQIVAFKKMEAAFTESKEQVKKLSKQSQDNYNLYTTLLEEKNELALRSSSLAAELEAKFQKMNQENFDLRNGYAHTIEELKITNANLKKTQEQNQLLQTRLDTITEEERKKAISHSSPRKVIEKLSSSTTSPMKTPPPEKTEALVPSPLPNPIQASPSKRQKRNARKRGSPTEGSPSDE